MTNPSVTVLIPTYKRAKLLNRVLDGLTKQSLRDFEVLVIVKASEDGTPDVIARYQNKLNIRSILQRQGFMIDALNLGIQNASGRIILFLDDDAIPFPDLIQRHVECYSQPQIGSVAGDVLQALPCDRTLSQFMDEPSDLLPPTDRLRAMTRVGFKIWNKPLAGQEHYLFYISRAGVVSINQKVIISAKKHSVGSLLGRGANMSVLASAVGDFRFPSSWILGFTFEQYLAWHVMEKGYDQIFSPKPRVYHLEHGQSLSRNFNLQRETLLYTEQKLLYYRLINKEMGLSQIHRIVWLLVETLIDVKRICLNHELHRISGLKSTFYASVFGFKMGLQRKLNLEYSLLDDLKRLHRR